MLEIRFRYLFVGRPTAETALQIKYRCDQAANLAANYPGLALK